MKANCEKCGEELQTWERWVWEGKGWYHYKCASQKPIEDAYGDLDEDELDD